ncbi:MAG: nickel pincer cofactor-dependent isomerase, group 22 [Limisphaerales bacterium]
MAIGYPRRIAPAMARVQQGLSSEHIADVRAKTCQRLLGAGLQKQIKPGAQIAITAGSRGIGGLIEILSGTIDAIRSAGGNPFIVPAMGSHGGATPEGQTEILRRLGVNDQTVDAPIKATMDTLDLGESKSGAHAHLDTIAATADGIIVLGRTKTHPENAEGIASGLLKMVAVGLGKQIGAQEAHSHGLWESVVAVPELTLAKSKVLFGLAVVENAFRQPVTIEAVPSNHAAFAEADRRLLKVAQPHVAKLPFDDLDLLIVDELGKNISGTGMDLNVIGKWRINGGEKKPNYRRIVVLSLTQESLGNGLGIGLADFTTRRFMLQYSPANTYINLLTATEPDSQNPREGPPPLSLPSDRDAIEVALYSAFAKNKPRVCRIKSTASLHAFWVSEALLPEVDRNPNLQLLEKPNPMAFDANGNLF